MEAYATILTYVIPGFIVLIILEEIAARMMGKKVNRPMDVISSLSSGMTNNLKGLMSLAIVIISYDWMVKHVAIFDIQSSFSLGLLAFIGHDFAGYWSHRWNHHINIFWNRHIVHHSSEDFNLSCALRQTISTVVEVYFFLYVPMAILGIPTTIVAIVGAIHLFAQFWYHTTLIDRMGFLENIIVTPSHHRVHHAINAEYLDKNFSEVFIIWDKLFGTFQAELDEVPAVYGTKRPARTWNPVIINFMHVWMLIKDAWYTKSWWDKLTLWFRPTGYRPADSAERFPVNVVEDVYNRPKYDTVTSKTFQAWAWFQLIIHNILIYHVMVNIAKFDYQDTIMYTGFLMISIFAFTTLMDKHKMAIPFEIAKIVFGLILIYQMGNWFGLDSIVRYGSWMVIGYMSISLLMTFYFLFIENNQRESVKSSAL